MKILGHPLHVMLIHFPSALFPMDVVCSSLGYLTGNIIFFHAAFFAMAGGVMTGWLAVFTGIFDLTGVVRDKPTNIKKAIYHGSINTTVLITYTLLTLMVFKKYPEIAPDHLSKIIFKACVVALMIVGNYLGGSLVFENKMEMKND